MHQESISLWQGNNSLPTRSALDQNCEVDVCVVGAGISGLLTAYLLAKEGKTVIVVDDGPVAGGQSIRTSAHLTNMLDERYYNLEKFFGHKGAKLAAESHSAAIDLIESLVRKYKIDCDFKRVDAYLFAGLGQPKDELEQELKAAHRAGISDAVILDKTPIETFSTGSSLCFPHQAQFSPLPFLTTLCEQIEGKKGAIYTNTHVKSIKNVGPRWSLTTDKKWVIGAKHVVLATNVPIGSRIFPHTKQAPYRTYVIAAEIPKGYVHKGLYYDTLDPYHYVRIEEGEEADILIVGGDDHRTAEQGDIASVYTDLEKWTKARFPLMTRVKYRWSGQVIEPVDGLAYIGRMKKGAEKYMITGHSGNGLTYAGVAALLITDLIQGRKNPWEKIYDPHRISFKTAAEFLGENLNTFWQYRDWATGGDIASVAELENNSGGIMRDGLKKIACYRDAEGTLHKMSATCPHLGAIVRWNKEEHCWECPAHGSRFSAKGKILQSPANGDLEPL